MASDWQDPANLILWNGNRKARSQFRENKFLRVPKEVAAAPAWLQEVIEANESLPWQRRGYLREAMLDQLTTAAGFAPLPSSASAAGGEGDQLESIREFLDQQRSGCQKTITYT